jgi:hypothetical protein
LGKRVMEAVDSRQSLIVVANTDVMRFLQISRSAWGGGHIFLSEQAAAEYI